MINIRDLQDEVFAKLRDTKIRKQREKRENISMSLIRIEDLLECILEEISK